MKLSDVIIQYRLDHGLSQRQFSQLCGLSNGYISMLENNLNPKTKQPITPSLPQLEKVSRALGISLSELFDIVDDMPVSLTREAPSSSMTALLPAEADALRSFRQLDSQDQGRALGYMERLLEEPKYQRKAGGAV